MSRCICGTHDVDLDFVPFSGKQDSYQKEKFMRGCRFLEAELQNMDRVLDGRYVFFPSVLS